MATMQDINVIRARFAALCRYDPLRFVMGAFPWGKKGALRQRFPALAVCPFPEPYASMFPRKTHGPLKWQLDFLRDLGAAMVERSFNSQDNRAVDPIRMAVLRFAREREVDAVGMDFPVGLLLLARMQMVCHFRPACGCVLAGDWQMAARVRLRGHRALQQFVASAAACHDRGCGRSLGARSHVARV